MAEVPRQLRRCPFCGGKNTAVVVKVFVMFVHCASCGARGPRIYTLGEGAPVDAWLTAVLAWNAARQRARGLRRLGSRKVKKERRR